MKSSVQEVQVYLIPACQLILRPPVPRFVLLRATQKIKSIAQDGLTLKLVANGKVIANIMSLLLFVNMTVQCNALLENIHAGWDMMTLVVLCQRYAPMEVRNNIYKVLILKLVFSIDLHALNHLYDNFFSVQVYVMDQMENQCPGKDG